MINSFGLKCPAKILFGSGELRRLPEEALRYGKKPLLVTGHNPLHDSKAFSALQSLLAEKFSQVATAAVNHEPAPADIDRIVADVTGAVDMVIAIGGGSVLDSGKAIAAMLKEQGSVATYLEGVGTRTPSGAKVPFIALPTTAGTGSEATANAVLSEVGANGFKKSLRHENYIPDLALVDPDLAGSCPPALSVACGMDCFTQLTEGYLSTKCSQLTDLLAVDGLNAVARSLKLLAGTNPPPGARADMAYATLLSGVVLTNAGLGTVHGFAAAVGCQVNIPHGTVCGTLMAETNLATLRKLRTSPATDQQRTGLWKYARLGEIFSGQAAKNDSWYQDFFVEELARLTEMLAMPRLSDYGITTPVLPAIIDATGNKNNPAELSADELAAILAARL